MVGLVVLLAVVVAMLTILVIGLLRSYGEVLRRLHDAGVGQDPAAVSTPAAPTQAADIAARVDASVAPPRQGAGESFVPQLLDVAGVTPSGDAVAVGVRAAGRVTLLAFLSSGCGTCANFWTALRAGERMAIGGRDVRVVAVTGGPQNEQPTAVARLAGPDLTVVMSDAAWQDYAVPATPYFVLADAELGVLGEGSAMAWAQLVGLLERAVTDRGFDLQATAMSPAATIDLRHDLAGREGRADAALAAAGIVPGDDQLYRSPLDGLANPPAPPPQ